MPVPMGAYDPTLPVLAPAPFESQSFDAVTVAFGIRNVCDLEGGIREMLRILKPGGRVAILEFSPQRSGPFHRLFRWYFHQVLPRLGRWVSRSRSGEEAYAYLPESVGEFPEPEPFAKLLEACGFENTRWRRLSFGIAAVHLAERRRDRERVVFSALPSGVSG